MKSIIANVVSGKAGDKVIWFVILMLSVCSLLSVYSASSSLAYKQESSIHLIMLKHALYLVLGLSIVYFTSRIPYQRFKAIAPGLLIFSVLLLVITIIFGNTINDARRWLTIPLINQQFQPSDVAKLALMLYLAHILTTKQETIKDFKNGFLPVILPICIICMLIAPNNLSTAMLIFSTSFIVMFIGRVSTKYLSYSFGVGIGLFGLLTIINFIAPKMVRMTVWTTRVQDFLGNSEGTFQNVQAKIAVANGGWFGMGAGDGSIRHFLPSAFSDFIYAAICEEYGIIGACFILGLFILFFFRIIRIVTITPKTFGALLVMGLGLQITIQALINMSVSLHLLPVTGLTLPLVSKGGTSLLLNSMAFGMILSVSRYVDKHAAGPVAKPSSTHELIENTTETVELIETGESVTQAEIPFDIAYTLDKTKAGKNTL